MLKQVDELYSYLTAVQGAANSGMSAPPSDIIPRLQAESGRLPVPFKQMLLSLAIGASSDTQRKEMENVKSVSASRSAASAARRSPAVIRWWPGRART